MKKEKKKGKQNLYKKMSLKIRGDVTKKTKNKILGMYQSFH